MSEAQREEMTKETSRPRRSYEPPRVEATGSFETLALGCGKTPDIVFPPGNPCQSNSGAY